MKRRVGSEDAMYVGDDDYECKPLLRQLPAVVVGEEENTDRTDLS